MGLFDWFVAELDCRACGRRSPPDNTTSVQTKLRESPRQNCLVVGDELAVTPETAEDARYTLLRPPDGPDVRILQHWTCPSCDGFPPQWLEVVVRSGRIASIESVVLDRDALDRAHFIEDESLYLASGRSDDPQAALRDLRGSLRR